MNADINVDIDIDDISIHDTNVDLLVSDEEEEVERAPKRYIRDADDLFDFYSEAEFKRRFILNKNSVKYGILPEIEAYLEKGNNPGLPITPVVQLLVCLRFHATASIQLLLGYLMTVSQPVYGNEDFHAYERG